MLKYLSLPSCNLVTNLMQISPTKKHITKDNINPNIFTPLKFTPSIISSKRLPSIMGIDIRKEYLALSSFTPQNLDVAIVVPLLLIPGMHAMPWDKPIIIA